MKETYITPNIQLTIVNIESSITSTSAGQLNFGGNGVSEPDIEDWTDNNSNTDKFDKGFLY